MKIEVTEEAIRKGTPGSKDFCPIARTIALQLEKGERCTVVGKSVRIYDCGDLVYKAKLPKKAFLFTKKFDNGESVKPIQFKLKFEEAY